MTPKITRAIVLHRINYGEADRILTLLTVDAGKISVIAKGVRKSKSKLAGGIELFSVSTISYIPGRQGMGTLVSTQLLHNYTDISHSLEKSSIGYSAIKLVNKTTEDVLDASYFELLEQTFMILHQKASRAAVAKLWFSMRFLQLDGRLPRLDVDKAGNKLSVATKYTFDFEAMTFEPQPDGLYNADHIKLLRLSLHSSPQALARVHVEEVIIVRASELAELVVRYLYQV